MGKHYLLSPSSMERIINCRGSLYGPPVSDPGSAAAEEGTTCHALLEMCLSFGVSPRDFLGSTDFNPKFPITIEMVEAVELFASTLYEVCKEFGIDHKSAISEQQLVHSAIPNEVFGGTSDCVAAGDDTLIILDLKYGHRPVYANSPQLTAYSLLVLDSLGRTFNKVVQIIVQPRCNPQVSRYEPGYEELTKLWADISEAAAYVLQNPDMTVPKPELLNAGPWCKYCKRREGCVAREAMVASVAEHAIIELPQAEGGTKLMTNGLVGVPTDQLVYWKDRAEVISEFLKDVDKALMARASQGEKIPGKKLVLKWGNRAYTEEEEAIRKKIPRVFKGITAKDITEQGVISPAKFEKLLKEKGLWADYKDKFEKICSSTQTGVKLVDARARGEEVRPETALEFLAAMKDSDSEST